MSGVTPAELREFADDIRALSEKWDAISSQRNDEGPSAREPVYFLARGFPSQP